MNEQAAPYKGELRPRGPFMSIRFFQSGLVFAPVPGKRFPMIQKMVAKYTNQIKFQADPSFHIDTACSTTFAKTYLPLWMKATPIHSQKFQFLGEFTAFFF